MNIAIVGAGLSGLAAAGVLRSAGHSVKLFDKGRGVGGRLATRRSPTGREFDHGAQYFTAKSAEFAAEVEAWVAAGVAAPWRAEVVTLTRGQLGPDPSPRTRFVGTPGMNSIAKHLARELDVATSTHVTRVNRSAGSWQLFADDRLLGHFDWLISSAPSPQTCALLADQAIAERTVASMTGCWATMIEFGSRVPVDFDAAFVNDSPLAWIARNNSKPSRDEHECWVLHGTSDWSQQHIESEPAEVEHYFYAALAEATSCELPASIHRAAHRWRYALPVAPLAEQAIFDFDHCLATCGDWCGGPRVEGAWQSGRRVGTQLAKFFG